MKEARFSENTVKYISKNLYLLNTGLLMCHISFLTFFMVIGAKIMFYFNIFSVLLYVALFFVLKYGKKNEDGSVNRFYAVSVYIEIYLHMVLATICMGYEYGFLLYCISSVSSAIFSGYLVSKEKKTTKLASVVSIICVITYVVIHIWSFSYGSIYKVDIFISKFFYLGNSLITLLFSYVYTKIFANTILKQEDSLKSIADYDLLTGLRNRRALLSILDKYIEICKQKKNVLCIAIMDIDFFKKINDNFGHDAGDEVLKKMADCLLSRENVLDDFKCARWGGEEFILLYLVDSDKKEDTIRELEYIRETIENNITSYKDKEITNTVTIGATFYDGSQPTDELIVSADKMLYKGKESTRNCVMY